MKLPILCIVLCINFLRSSALPSSKVASLLTSLQSDHYTQVQAALELANYLDNQVIFVDDDLRTNALSYLTSVSTEAESDLDTLKTECENQQKCLACFSNDRTIPTIAKKTSSALVTYFENQKKQYEETFEETVKNIQESALLSDYVYEKYGSKGETFEANARAFYEKIQKALRAESALLEKVVEQTKAELIGHYAEITSKAYDGIRSIYDETVQCVDQFVSDQ